METFTAWLEKNWKGIAIGLAVLVVLFLLWQVGSSASAAIKKFFGIKEEKDTTFTPQPPPTPETTGVNLTAAQFQQVRALSQRLHTDMSGISVLPGSRDTEAYGQLLTLTDPMFLAVYNDFNFLYMSEGNGTLRQWIEDESFAYSWSVVTPWGIYDGARIKDAIFQRMDILNLP